MMAQLDQAHASGKTLEPPKEPGATPAAPPTPATPAAPKVEAKLATPAPATPPKPEEAKADEPDWSKAPPKWYKIYEQHKSKSTQREQELQAKIKNLESKPVEHAGDAKKIEAYEKQLEEMRGESGNYKRQLAQLDFTKSDEYKTQFYEPASQIYKEAVGFVGRLKAKDGESERQATQADFDFIRNLPADARRRAATEMFGDSAPDVLDYTRELDRLNRAAKIATENHAANHERSTLEREGIHKREDAEFQEMRNSALDGIKSNENWGKWFREDENDPEASQLIRDGYSEIEKLMKDIGGLPADQRAAYSALYMARAAATPRLMLENNRLQAKVEAFQEELEKIRGTDPGAKGKQGENGGGTEAKQPMGIEQAAAAFDNMPR